MFRQKITRNLLDRIYSRYGYSSDVTDSDIKPILHVPHVLDPSIPDGKIEGNALYAKLGGATGTTTVISAYNLQADAYMPLGGDVRPSVHATVSYSLEDWSPIYQRRLPVLRGWVIQSDGSTVKCSIKHSTGYHVWEFKSPRALASMSPERIIPYWLLAWSAYKDIKQEIKDMVHSGIPVDDHGNPIIEFKTQKAPYDIDRQFKNMLALPPILPFRSAAGMELVHKSVTLWDCNAYLQQLKDRHDVYFYNRSMVPTAGKMLIYEYQLQDVPQSRIEHSIQFSDTYWAEGADANDAEEDMEEDVEEQETGESNE